MRGARVVAAGERTGMTKRRPARTNTPEPAPPIVAADRWRSRRAVAIALSIGAVAAALAVGMFVVGRARSPDVVAFPPPREAAPASLVARADFVGAARCADCHVAEFAAWERSTHGRAGGTPATGIVLTAFNGRPIRFRDAVVTPRVDAGGRYAFVVAPEGHEAQTLTVDGVVGGGHMAGGGTQGFVTRRADGTTRFLPFELSRSPAGWFCNTGSRTNEGWQPITASMPLAACGDWPPVRVLGDVPRFANCQGCHGSQIEARFDSAARRYVTSITSLAINCESCHGPGRRHVELAASGQMARTADIGMPPLAVLDKDQSLRVCSQCHSLKDQLRPGHLAGDSLERFYSLGLPLLGDRPLTPDGRVRTFAYQETQRFSECYRKGGMRCTDCHDPHTQGYRDVTGAALTGRLNDRQCTSCHASLMDRVEAHTHHRAESPGSRCVSCHMPYLQHPEVGTAIRYARSDHTIPIPRPAHDSAMGVRPACASCHAGVAVAVLDAQVAAWTKRPRKPLSPSVAAQIALGTARLTPASARALLADDDHIMARIGALARLVEALAANDRDWLDDSVAERLVMLTSDRDPDVAALALATLHLGRGEDVGTRRVLARALTAAGGHDGALRDRWALVLGYVGDRLSAERQTAAAIVVYRKALEIVPTNARVLVNLANAQRDGATDPAQLIAAIDDYRRAIRLDPAASLTLVNLGVAQVTLSDTASALASWRDAARLDPGEPLALFNLGNVSLVRGQFAEAATAYRAALGLDNSLVPAHFNLTRALVAAGDHAGALRAIRDGLAFDSSNVEARAMAAQLQQTVAGRGAPTRVPQPRR